jgi:magnesium transporter
MIEILKYSKGKLETIDRFARQSWINVVSPNEAEIEKLLTFKKIPKDLLMSLTDMDEIPMMERQEGFTFFIIRTPQKKLDDNKDLEYSTIPLGIIVYDDCVITVCYRQNDAIEKLKSNRAQFGTNGLLPHMMLVSAKLYLTYLKDVNRRIYDIQKDLEKSTKNEEIIKLLGLEKSLAYFSTSLKLNGVLIEKLAKNGMYAKSRENRDILEDAMDENKQAVEMTSIYSNILTGMMSAFASVISNNLNIVIKFLTSITIILMIPTLIASIYGMNVGLPFQDSGDAFLIIMAISAFFSVFGIFIFLKREVL